MAAVTRKKTSCPVYGCASELPINQLPTIANVMQFYMSRKSEHSKTTPSSTIINEVATNVIDIWCEAGIPTITLRSTENKLETLHQELRNIMKKKGVNKEKGIDQLRMNSQKLFDIAACKCSDFDVCCCERNKRVPNNEREFLSDQREARRMIIGAVDRKTTSRIKKRKERELKRKKYYKSHATSAHTDETDKPDNNSSCESVDSDSASDSSGDVYMQPEEEESSRNNKSLPTLSRECDRYGVSNTVGAAIATAVLVDYGLVTDDDKSSAIDRSKLWRERERYRTSMSERTGEKCEPTSLYFDGRKDLTICLPSVNRKCQIVEEHVCLLQEPGSVYLGHISPNSGSSANIFEAMCDLFSDNEISLDSIIAIGCDGTAVNTGKHAGIIRQFELHVKRPLQWFICMFHFNELPLRHLFVHLDGTTAGPNAFTGPLGKSLISCQSLEIVSFKTIDGDLPELDDFESLSKDQRYLYEMCLAVKSGSISESLRNREPGNMAHSRWLTAANRILRLYVSTTEPSQSLVTLTEYVIKVYAPVWFSIKLKPQCYYGATHLWKCIHFSRFLSSNDRDVVDRCIQHNAYYGHPENVILNMMVDERKHIRELAARKVKAARESSASLSSSSSGEIRKFTIPQLNFEASDYYELVNWVDNPRQEPPITCILSDYDIQEAIKSGSMPHLEKYPCHTQAVERHIKVVTDAAKCVCGKERREGYIRAKLESRKKMSKYTTKSEWKS